MSVPACLILGFYDKYDSFTVLPRPREMRRDQPAFKVKSILKGTEFDGEYAPCSFGCSLPHVFPVVSRQELVVWLQQQIAEQKRIDASTSGFADYAAHVAAFPPEVTAACTGISVDELDALAHLIGRAKRASFWWTMGVNQSHQGTRTAQAIIDLALLTGNVGRLYPSEAYVTLNGEQRKAMADQIGTVSKLRLRESLGRLGQEDMAAVERAIRLQLGLLQLGLQVAPFPPGFLARGVAPRLTPAPAAAAARCRARRAAPVRSA